MNAGVDTPGVGVADLDAEIDWLLAAPGDRAGHEGGGHDDQATRLRRLVADATGQPVPTPTFAAPRPVEPPPARTGLARVVAVASGKGGVGKTNVAVNLAVALAQRGLRVILVDADLGTANADVLCGLTPVGRLNHLVTPLPVCDGGQRRAADLLIDAPGGFRLLPGSAGVARMADLAPTEQRRLLEVIGELERDADVLIVDTAAGVGRSVTSLVEAADLGLLVTTPEPTSIADVYALLKCLVLAESGQWNPELGPKLRLAINQVADQQEATNVHARLSAVCRKFLGIRPELLGAIAQDLRVAQSVRCKRPFVLHAPECDAARHMVALAARLTDQLGLRPENPAARPPTGFRSSLARILLGRSS